ncbi:hypothetical protein ACVIJ6_007800 [Bradyrhizobium sp. USDA 4369]
MNSTKTYLSDAFFPLSFSLAAMAERVSLIIEDLPMPQAPDTPIEIGRPLAWTMISATVSATPEKFRKSRSVSLSGHIGNLACA